LRRFFTPSLTGRKPVNSCQVGPDELHSLVAQFVMTLYEKLEYQKLVAHK